MRFSQSTHLLMCFSLETLKSIIKIGKPIYLELIDLVNSVIISNDLTQMVNFPTQIPGCDSHSPALLDSFLSSATSICSNLAFLPLGNFDNVVVSVSPDFPINSKRDTLFHPIVHVGIDVYIPHRKYQIKFHSSHWFSATCATAIAHGNHFFICTNRINLLNLK